MHASGAFSGPVSVSTKALRDLPLPAAADVRKFFSQRGRSDDEAVVAAYAASAVRKRATPTRTKPNLATFRASGGFYEPLAARFQGNPKLTDRRDRTPEERHVASWPLALLFDEDFVAAPADFG